LDDLKGSVLISRIYRNYTEINYVSAADVLKAIIRVWQTFVLPKMVYAKTHYHNEKFIIRAKYLASFDDRIAVILPNFECTMLVNNLFRTIRYETKISFHNKEADQTCFSL
jgi:hypothetical protein